MKEEGKQYKLTLRLPKVLEDHVRKFAKTYDLSLNDAVKFTLIQHHLNHSTDNMKVQSEVTCDPTGEVKLNNKAESQSDPTGEVTGEVKDATPSRAPCIMSNYVKVYNINSKNNSIHFFDPKVQEAWRAWKKYRGIKVSEEKFQQRYIDKVLKHESVEQLVERWHRAISRQWTGFVFNNETFGEVEQTTYGDEDL
jgi:hypothetical protein